ncbi:unnamed protein product [Calypogeia fissa]
MVIVRVRAREQKWQPVNKNHGKRSKRGGAKMCVYTQAREPKWQPVNENHGKRSKRGGAKVFVYTQGTRAEILGNDKTAKSRRNFRVRLRRGRGLESTEVMEPDSPLGAKEAPELGAGDNYKEAH